MQALPLTPSFSELGDEVTSTRPPGHRLVRAPPLCPALRGAGDRYAAAAGRASGLRGGPCSVAPSRLARVARRRWSRRRTGNRTPDTGQPHRDRERRVRPWSNDATEGLRLIPEFRAELNGRAIAPDDAEYDRARTVFSGAIDRRPALIVRVADASDVSRVIALARESGLELAVRSGGHSGAGHGVSDGGIVLDLSDMRGLEIDAERRTAWAETGLTAGDYTAAAGAHGLATGFGDAGSVGIGGITLGGGVGFLARKHGLTIDDLLAAEVVTADGRAPARGRGEPSGPLLGDPRRRRQLRRRDPVPVPPARGGHDRGRDADPAGDARRDRVVRRRGGGRARRSSRRSPTS